MAVELRGANIRLPKYSNLDFYQVVTHLTYKGLVRDLDNTHQLRDLPPASRNLVDAAWCQLLAQKCSEWDPRGFKRHFDSDDDVETGKRKLLIKAFEQVNLFSPP